ncbi:hypothetical protein EB796_020475 [Bugula neritina]|uniref:Uncharacterized protein n=1 Tax=Bugula neritina TaxID=10212 RepID=A0A7J7J6E7_BUGNE|nr:hypothetical protein EB796_020475 [Bugula neritina]
MGSFNSVRLAEISEKIKQVYVESVNSAHLTKKMEKVKPEERIDVGIKKLITLVEMAKQSEDSQIKRLYGLFIGYILYPHYSLMCLQYNKSLATQGYLSTNLLSLCCIIQHLVLYIVIYL